MMKKLTAVLLLTAMTAGLAAVAAIKEQIQTQMLRQQNEGTEKL